MSEATQSLLCDLFADNQLFQGIPRISRRVVAWGASAQTVVLPHSAVAVSEQQLLDRLWAGSSRATETIADPGVWQIISARGQLPQTAEEKFGSRTAFVSEVVLTARAGRETCWIESLDAGWLFLFPVGGTAACLIAVGAPAQSLLAQSRLIAQQVESATESAAQVPAYPRILSQLCGSGWLACGSAAMAFDPLCGEGAANAVREAILAAAVVHAAAQGFNSESLLAHYNARLMSGFLRHLQMCQHYYSTGGSGHFWRSELEGLQQGVTCLSGRLQPKTSPAFRLVDFQLEPI